MLFEFFILIFFFFWLFTLFLSVDQLKDNAVFSFLKPSWHVNLQNFPTDVTDKIEHKLMSRLTRQWKNGNSKSPLYILLCMCYWCIYSMLALLYSHLNGFLISDRKQSNNFNIDHFLNCIFEWINEFIQLKDNCVVQSVETFQYKSLNDEKVYVCINIE